MFERYTEPARRVLFFARYEASQFGSMSIETEHVLLGLLREARGVSARLLATLHVSPDTVRAEIERRSPRRDKVSTSVEMPFSRETTRVLQFAAEEADLLMQRHIGPEHLLLGLLREQESVGASTLAGQGVRLDEVRRALVKPAQEAPNGDLAAEAGTRAREWVERISVLVERLARAPSGGDEARGLVAQIQRNLDALKRELDG